MSNVWNRYKELSAQMGLEQVPPGMAWFTTEPDEVTMLSLFPKLVQVDGLFVYGVRPGWGASGWMGDNAGYVMKCDTFEYMVCRQSNGEVWAGKRDEPLRVWDGTSPK